MITMSNLIIPLVMWTGVFAVFLTIAYIIKRALTRNATAKFNYHKWMIKHDVTSWLTTIYFLGAVIIPVTFMSLQTFRAQPTKPVEQRMEYPTEKSVIIRKDIPPTPQDTGVQPVSSYKEELQQLRDRQK